MENIFISVIITAYNRRNFLLGAIKSVLSQTLPKNKYEIIVIKNFSDDRIDKYIEGNNIKNILMDGTIGQFLSIGIKESRGNIISFLDDDDLFFNNKLEYVYSIFKNNKKLVYYHNLPKFIDENNIYLSKTNHSISFNISCISIKRNIINLEALKNLYIIQDSFMYCSALESHGMIIRGKQILTYYRFHNSTSNYKEKNDSKIIHKNELFVNYLLNFENLYKVFKNDRVKIYILNYIITLKIEMNILHKLGYAKINYKIKKIEILRYLFIFNYWDSRKKYYLKFLKLLELYMPIKMCKKLELLY